MKSPIAGITNLEIDPMIKFFRRIRFDLMENNKTGKYLKYAIGEIILVVIGILIALSINNWNEVRRNKNEESAILQNLDDNLILARSQSQLLVLKEKKLKKDLMLVLGIHSITPEINNDFISDTIFKNALWQLESEIPVINAYTNLKNTNKLGLIKNQKIKEKFTSLEVSLNELESMLADRLNVQQIRIDDIAENDINFIPLIGTMVPNVSIKNEKENNYEVILKNQRIRNLLGIKLVMTQDVLEYRENLDTEINNLKSLIESELIN